MEQHRTIAIHHDRWTRARVGGLYSVGNLHVYRPTMQFIRWLPRRTARA